MNAEELIAEVIETVDDPKYEDSEVILRMLNASQRRIAELILLPDLKDGYATVQTVVDANEVALPEDFHRNLFMAMMGAASIDIFPDIVSLRMSRAGVLNLDDGTVGAVTVKKGFLVYQKVPSAPVDISLGYYRLPVPMTESSKSFADGMAGNDDFDWALIHDVCAKCFNKIEDGMEGAKVNTKAHTDLFLEKIGLLDEEADRQGKVFPMRPSTNLGWLGVK